MSCPFPLKNRHPRVIPGESLKTSGWHPLLARLLFSPCYHHSLHSISSARQRVVQVRVSTRWFLSAVPSFSLFSSAPEGDDPFCSVPAPTWAYPQAAVPSGEYLLHHGLTCSPWFLGEAPALTWFYSQLAVPSGHTCSAVAPPQACSITMEHLLVLSPGCSPCCSSPFLFSSTYL